MDRPVFTGTCTALITPFRHDGGIDYAAFARQIDRQIAAGIDALCVCGTTGESAALSAREHEELTDFCLSHVAGRCKVLAGCGSNDTAAALDLCRHAQAAGADALLIVTPYYNKTTQTGLVRHYEHLADRVDRPIILYNVPARTGLSFTAETYEILSRHPRIHGIKEASGDFSLLAETVARCGDALHLWSGNDDQTVPLISLGAKGVISVLSNVRPRETMAMTHAALDGDYETAGRMQCALMPLIDALFCEVNPIPVKRALELEGFPVGAPRLPLTPLSDRSLPRLVDALSA